MAPQMTELTRGDSRPAEYNMLLITPSRGIPGRKSQEICSRTTDFSDGTDGDLSEAGSGIPAEQAGYRVLPGRTFILLLIVILLLILISLSGGVSLSNQDGADWCVGRG